MFTAFEDEVVRILRANLSPTLVPPGNVLRGPVAPPNPADLPRVAFAVQRFDVITETDDSPPRGVKVPVADSFSDPAATFLSLTERPLEPLRGVEVQPAGADPVLLRERDDYSVDYVNGSVRLRRAPEANVAVDYFTRRALRVISNVRLRVESRLQVWADPDAAAPGNLNGIASVALSALVSNAPNLDGFLTQGNDIVDSGRVSLGVRQSFIVFETLQPENGERENGHWRTRYGSNAWLVLVPRDEEIGIMRQIAASLTWNASLAQRVLGEPPPLLDRPVTDVDGVDAALAAALATEGIITIGELAQARPSGDNARDTATGRARTLRERASEAVRVIVLAGPDIDDLAGFLGLALATVDAAALTALDLPTDVANEAVAAIADILAAASATDLTMSDLFAV